jgi:hypothetical protein
MEASTRLKDGECDFQGRSGVLVNLNRRARAQKIPAAPRPQHSSKKNSPLNFPIINRYAKTEMQLQ